MAKGPALNLWMYIKSKLGGGILMGQEIGIVLGSPDKDLNEFKLVFDA